MSTKTREKEINEHGEEVEKPLFGPGSDEANTTGNPSDPRGDVASGDSSDPRAEKALSDEELSQKEEKSTEKSESKTDSSEKESLFSGEESPSRFSNFRKRLMVNGRRKLAIGGIVGVLGFGGVGLFGVIQGPLEFIHLSQLLQKYYTRSNENFGDDRSFRTIIYRASGKSEKGRLGTVGNLYADKLEKKILDTRGIRPIYHDNARGLLAGYEIVDEHKARQGGFLTQLENTVPGSKITQVNSLQGLGVRGANGTAVNPTARIFHIPAGTSSKNVRASTRLVVKSINLNKVSTAIGSRITVRRVGAKFHYLNRQRVNRDAKADAATNKKTIQAFEEGFQAQRDLEINNGIQKPGLPGKTQELIDKINTAIQGKTKVAADIIRKAIIKGAGPVAIVGALCTANDLGNAAQDTKFTNNVLPLIRNFWYFTSVGEQAKSGNSISLDELGVLKKTLYDKETGTSVYQAAPLQAEAGQKPTGADVPIDARPNKLNNKPTAFTAVSKVLDFTIFPVPFKDDITIGTGCSAIDAISGLPGISQLSSLLEGAINLALGAIGTSTDELMAGVINLINGKAVDTRAVGGEAGALLGIGGKLAGIDQSLTAGGASMSPVAAAQLKEEQRLADIQDNQSKSLFARYLDPYESTSLVGATSVGLSGRTNPIQSIASAFSGLFSPFKAKASAAPVPYDYGIRDYGYTVHDQDDELFADPYANAVIVEPELIDLNDKYSKCFGMKATVDDTGVHLESSLVNILKLENDADYNICHEFNDSSASDEAIMFKRYRFYLADAQYALSLACYEGLPNDPRTLQACAEIGGGVAPPPTTTQTTAASSTIDLALLAKDSDQILCATGTRDLGVVQTKFTFETIVPSGVAPKIRLCQVSSIGGQGNDTSGNEINGGAVVSSVVSGAWFALGTEAKAAGINLVASSSFRLADSCGGTGDGTNCARPGKSPHQSGVAIDFANVGGFTATGSSTSCSGRMINSSADWKWLKDNAEKFGIFQYSRESWHWDPFYPIGNRCDSTGTATGP